MDIGKKGGEEEREGKEFDESCLFRMPVKLREASRPKGLCITLNVFISHRIWYWTVILGKLKLKVSYYLGGHHQLFGLFQWNKNWTRNCVDYLNSCPLHTHSAFLHLLLFVSFWWKKCVFKLIIFLIELFLVLISFYFYLWWANSNEFLLLNTEQSFYLKRISSSGDSAQL